MAVSSPYANNTGWIFFHNAADQILTGAWDLPAATLAMVLTTSSQDVTSTGGPNLSWLTAEVGTSHGYERALSIASSWSKVDTSTGAYTFRIPQQTFTASTGTFAPAYAVIYADSITNDPLVCYMTFNGRLSVNVSTGRTVTVGGVLMRI